MVVAALAFKVGETEDEMSSGKSVEETTISGRIATAVERQAAEQLVTDVRIGLGYTAVELADGRVGVAFTFREAARRCCCAFQGMHPLSGRHASDLVTLLGSADPIEAAVGLACVNALANEVDERWGIDRLVRFVRSQKSKPFLMLAGLRSQLICRVVRWQRWA